MSLHETNKWESRFLRSLLDGLLDLLGQTWRLHGWCWGFFHAETWRVRVNSFGAKKDWKLFGGNPILKKTAGKTPLVLIWKFPVPPSIYGTWSLHSICGAAWACNNPNLFQLFKLRDHGGRWEDAQCWNTSMDHRRLSVCVSGDWKGSTFTQNYYIDGYR